MNLLAEKSKIGISYNAYHEIVEKLVKEGKTSGPKQSEEMTHYTEMNLQRMNRISKTISIDEELQGLIGKIQRKMIFLVLAEAWCGDVAQNIPIIQKMVDLNPNWEMRIVWRDENIDLMNLYKTNGGIAIPKVILLDADTYEELAVWGPRPEPAQQMVMNYKKDPKDVPYMEFVKEVQLWYAKDKGETLQAEWKTLLSAL